MDEGGERAIAVGGPIIDEKFVAQVELVTAVGAGAETVVAVDGRNEDAGPANGEIFGGDVGGGGDVVPGEVDGGIGASGSGRASEIRVGEVFGGETDRKVGRLMTFRRGRR